MDVPDQPLTELRQTPKGRGVFAIGDLPEGTPVIVGRPIALSPERTNYSLQVNFDRHVDLDEPGRLINHSCDPSVYPVDNEYGGYTFVTRRAIAANEEITFDYDTTEFFSIAVDQCLCGSSRCRGRTRGFYYLPDAIKQEYGHQIGGYNRKWIPADDRALRAHAESEQAPKELLPYITSDAVELYTLWTRAAEHFPAGFSMLSVASPCSLFSLWPLAARASRVVYAPLGATPVAQDLRDWKLRGDAQQDATSSSDRSFFDWTPYVLLASLSAGHLDPSPEDLHLRHAHVRGILELSSATSAISSDLSGARFDVINVPDASVLTATDVGSWLDSLGALLQLLRPGGHLVLTLPASAAGSAGQTRSSSRMRELTPGTCLEAVQSKRLGLKVAFESLTEATAGATLVVLSLKPESAPRALTTKTPFQEALSL